MTKIQLRRDTAANWSTNNPTPSAGEPCFETDTGKLKIGDGTTSYTQLDYLSTGGSSSGLEVCDIGMALYVDETKGLRRYLNGQVVDHNTNTEAFFTRLKDITTLHPSLLCTEEEWQTAKTMSAFGQVGKFVFNYSGEDIVSVRLPRVVNVQGLFDLQNLGMTVDESLPNITGSLSATCSGSNGNLPTRIGCMNATGTGVMLNAGTSSVYVNNAVISVDASRSSSTYQDNAPVQQEAIQYPYFIQIATGSETENNIINEIELNNPYSLFDSKYSDHELNNLSWLKSEGQWNAKAVYTDAYDKLLKVQNGTETVEGLSVKLSTETYTDYDFVLNTAEETFRLPLKTLHTDDTVASLSLYFYVGETVQNANLIDAGRLLEILPAKLDKLQIPIGQPQITLSNILEDNEIWLEGATVSRTTYAELFKIYGTTYGTGDGSTTFVLPNFKNRAIWGYNEFGYIEAGLPNITGNLGFSNYALNWGADVRLTASGAFNVSGETKTAGSARGAGSGNNLYNFNASRSNSIYGNSKTVQPPAIKVRVKTRYK